MTFLVSKVMTEEKGFLFNACSSFTVVSILKVNICCLETLEMKVDGFDDNLKHHGLRVFQGYFGCRM